MSCGCHEICDQAGNYCQSGEDDKAINLLLQYPNDQNACYYLGLIYEQKKGDFAKASECYERVATKGDHFLAVDKLGGFYEEGKGVRQDFKKAFYWYKKAAGTIGAWSPKRVHYASMAKVTQFYECGIGTEKDSAKAAEWYAVLEDAGYVAVAGFVIVDKVLVEYTGGDSDVYIPDGIVAIGNFAFEDNVGIESVILPESVKCIRFGAFSNCKNLKKMYFANEGLELIDDQAFSGCSSLKRVEVPKGVIGIGEYAFSECANLSIVVIPESVEKTGDCAFGLNGNITICVKGHTGRPEGWNEYWCDDNAKVVWGIGK